MITWKQLLYVCLTSSSFLPLLRWRVPVTHTALLMYHELAPDEIDIEAWTVVRRNDFVKQVEYLRRYYDVVSLDTALERMRAPHLIKRPMALITFDDGDKGNVETLLPVVEQLKVPVAIYIATRQVMNGVSYWFDRVINAVQTDELVVADMRAHGLGVYEINKTHGSHNWERIQALLQDLKTLMPEAREHAVDALVKSTAGSQFKADCRMSPLTIEDVKTLASSPYITIGAHSHCHNILPQLPPAEVEQSVRTSKTLLEQWTGKPVHHFAYPNGSYNDVVIDIVRQMGFHSAVGVGRGMWKPESDLHAIPRIGVGRYDTLDQFKLKLTGGIQQFFPWRAKTASKSAGRAWSS